MIPSSRPHCQTQAGGQDHSSHRNCSPAPQICHGGGRGNSTVIIRDSSITILKTGAIPKRTMDRNGFELPKKQSRSVEYKCKPVETGNMFDVQSMDVQQSGPSSAPQGPPAPKAVNKRMPPIRVRVPVVEPFLLVKLKAAGPTCYFEYVKNGLRIMTKSHQDHSADTKLLQATKVKYFTYNPTPGSTAKFITRGLPPNATCEEIATELKNCGIEITYVKQVTKGRINAETRKKILVPFALWVLTIEKTLENMGKLKALIGICNFRIRSEDYQGPKRQLQCFWCQGHGHRADYCNPKQRCVECTDDHAAKKCTKRPRTTAKCPNCQGDHPSSSKQCPAAKKYNERKTRSYAAPAPNVNLNREFPALPIRPAP